MKKNLWFCFLGYCLAHYGGNVSLIAYRALQFPQVLRIMLQLKAENHFKEIHEDTFAQNMKVKILIGRRSKINQISNQGQKSSWNGSAVPRVCKAQATVTSCRYWLEPLSSPTETGTSIFSCLLPWFELFAWFFHWHILSQGEKKAQSSHCSPDFVFMERQS